MATNRTVLSWIADIFVMTLHDSAGGLVASHLEGCGFNSYPRLGVCRGLREIPLSTPVSSCIPRTCGLTELKIAHNSEHVCSAVD